MYFDNDYRLYILQPAPSEADKGAILDLNDGGSISLNIEVDLGSEVAIPIDSKLSV